MTGVGPILEARGIVKRFGPLVANDVATFAVHPGEVVALLGENGAGKSTLCKILFGYYRGDAGEIQVAGRPATITSPREARRLGIGMVFQNFSLIPALTVWENVALFVEDLPWVLRPAALIRRMRRDAERLHLRVEPAGPQRSPRRGKHAKVLAPQEADGLFRTLAALRNDGYAIIFISHKLHEAIACADRIAVMRQGRIVATLRAHEASEATLLGLMFGDASASTKRPTTRPPGEMVLELESIATAPEVGRAVLRDLSLCLRAGEILGVAGVAGNGQRELADVILGLRRATHGVKRLWGENATRWSAARIRQRGVASIPEDPLALAIVPVLTVRDNLVLGSGGAYCAGLGFDWERLAAAMDRCVAQLGFPPLAYNARAGVLSGGNLQRLVLTRELSRGPKLIVALYPTRGLDARSAKSLHGLLDESRATGAAVLLVSEDLDELFVMSNRLIVVRAGRVAGSFLPAAFRAEAVGSCMVGATDAA
jgi:general nucleoside transport system ATP-binding protein